MLTAGKRETQRARQEKANFAVNVLSRPLLRELLIFAGFCLLTVLMTWPWVLNLRSGIPDKGDPYAHAYFLWWDYHQTFSDPLHLFDATIFYPYRYSLAFSENDFGIAVLFFPLFALGLRPLTIQNLAVLTSFAFAGYAAFRCSRTLTGDNGAAAVAGVIFAFVPYRFQHLSHLPLIFSGWIPLALEALILFARRLTWASAAWLGVTLVMNAFTCLTWAVLTLLPLILSAVVVVQWTRRWKEKGFWWRAAVTTTLSLLAVAPFGFVYSRVATSHGFARTPAEVQAYSARLVNWFAAGYPNKLWAGLNANHGGVEFALFPGFLPIILSLLLVVGLGLFLAGRRFRDQSNQSIAPHSSSRLFVFDSYTPAIIIALIWLALGFMGSLGMNFPFHRFLYRFVPLFEGMRVATRWAMIAYLGLAILGGVSAAMLVSPIKRYRWSLFVYGVIVLALLFEQRAAPLELVQGAPDPDTVTLRLKRTPMRGGVVVLPTDHEQMLRATEHRRPLVNAISSFIPPLTDQINKDTAEKIAPEFMDLLEKIPASYLVIHNDRLLPGWQSEYEIFLVRALASGRLRFVNRFDGHDDLYAVVKTEPYARSEAAAPFPLVDRDWSEMIEQNESSILTRAGRSQSLYRIYLATTGALPRYADFMKDIKTIGRGVFRGSENEEETFARNLHEFADRWVEREPFRQSFRGLDEAKFVDRLLTNAGITIDPQGRATLIDDAKRETRATILLRIVADRRFIDKENDRSVVLLNYFAYLQRNPGDPPDRDLSGFEFWLQDLAREHNPAKISVAFQNSIEYRRRHEAK